MTRLLVSLLGAILLGVTAGAVAQPSTTRQVPVDGAGAYTDVGPAGLAAMLARKDFPLINVHIPYEGEVPATDRFIAFDRIETRLAELPADKAARIVLYCQSGRMSATAARTLVKLGYRDVWNLDGGMIAWRQAGQPLVHRPR
jgi:rhodanese-related sulfurtransferase